MIHRRSSSDPLDLRLLGMLPLRVHDVVAVLPKTCLAHLFFVSSAGRGVMREGFVAVASGAE